MNCEKCQDRGFIEEEHGLNVILCDCEKGKEVAEKQGIPWREDDSSSGTGQLDTSAGSTDTGKSKQPSKRKAKKKARTRAG